MRGIIGNPSLVPTLTATRGCLKWRARLLKVMNDDTAGPKEHPRFRGWWLESHDLCAAKLCAGREKDLNFVRALIESDLVDRPVIGERLGLIEAEYAEPAQRTTA